jgi:uncharacterized pyridoxamine 5'-phosphate oxidase family protein
MMDWEKAFEPRQEIVLATVKKDGAPHAIYVLSMGIVGNKLLIAVCSMVTTLENIKQNNKVVVIGKSKRGYYRISGEAKIYSSGKYLEIVSNLSRPPLPKQAITVDIKEVYDLDQGRKIYYNYR